MSSKTIALSALWGLAILSSNFIAAPAFAGMSCNSVLIDNKISPGVEALLTGTNTQGVRGTAKVDAVWNSASQTLQVFNKNGDAIIVFNRTEKGVQEVTRNPKYADWNIENQAIENLIPNSDASPSVRTVEETNVARIQSVRLKKSGSTNNEDQNLRARYNKESQILVISTPDYRRIVFKRIDGVITQIDGGLAYRPTPDQLRVLMRTDGEFIQNDNISYSNGASRSVHNSSPMPEETIGEVILGQYFGIFFN